MPIRESEIRPGRLGLPNIIIFLAGMILLPISFYFDGVDLLRLAGFPADRLYHPRVLGDLVVLRVVGGMIATLLMVSRVICWRYPHVARSFYTKIEAFTSAVTEIPWFIPLGLIALVLMKTTLQLGLFVVGYTLYEGDDFARTLKADYWVQHRKFDLGWDLGYLALVGGGQLPFSDYLFGLGLALHRDLFLTPKIVNLIVSAIAVIAVYFLGRELFGRTAGFLTAVLFAFLPWHVWLGISGMTADMPSVVFITLFALFLFRWLETEQPLTLLAAAGFLSVANGFRYENWLFSLIFSALIVLSAAWRWRKTGLDWRAVSVAVCALTIVNAFPLFWMVASYYMLGDWLPALHKSAAFMVSPDTTKFRTSSISIPVLLLGSFPFEFLTSIVGVALFLKSDRRTPFRVYLAVLLATFLLFGVMFQWQLPSYGGVARYLLPFIVFLLPYAGFLLTQFLKAPELRWNQGLFVTSLVFVTIGTFDIMRAFNYPGTAFPKDAIYAGWTVRALQELGTISENGKILIERAEDWGDVSIVALANKPERFVLLNEIGYRQAGLSGDLPNRPAPVVFAGNEGVRGNACDQGFQAEACRNSFLEERFDFVILSSPARVQSFQETFHASSWRMGRYHIFKMTSFQPSRYATHPD